MQGDFSRVTFDKARHFSRVLAQQGRVQLDADGNEQAAILLHYLHALAKDLIGDFGGPIGQTGFGIGQPANNDFAIGTGRYYVDGLLAENDDIDPGTGKPIPWSYFNQPDYQPLPTPMETRALPESPYLVYLDVWEQHLCMDQAPAIREVALGEGGPDTASRAKLVWQVKIAPADAGLTPDKILADWPTWEAKWQAANRGVMLARLNPGIVSMDSCILPVDAQYRGEENQLYRVEVHCGTDSKSKPTFKWSRDNASVVYPVTTASGATVTLAHIGHDTRTQLKIGDWVEVTDDVKAGSGKSGQLLQVSNIDLDEMIVTLSGAVTFYDSKATTHPILRRWDQSGKDATANGLELSEGSWQPIEAGIEIQFADMDVGGNRPIYRTGDYWLISARMGMTTLEWPNAIPPHGVEHHYAPVALVVGTVVTDLRCVFSPLDCKVV